MLMVDLTQEVQFPYYDSKKKEWKEHTGTIAELLKVYTDYKHIQIYSTEQKKWGNFEKVF